MDYLALASNPETVEKVEGCMKVWIKQTEQVIPRNPWLVSDATSLGCCGRKFHPGILIVHISQHMLLKRFQVAFICLFD